MTCSKCHVDHDGLPEQYVLMCQQDHPKAGYFIDAWVKRKRPTPPQVRWAWGDKVKEGLDRVGITQEFAAQWLGCGGCRGRQEKLNALGAWAASGVHATRKNLLKLLGRTE
jgi:hypothetical protein